MTQARPQPCAMARKLRLEFPGACYHVLNRGNYKTDIFRSDRTKAAFEACLFTACEKSGWRLHAFVLMRNHYHLALETPEGNLVAGMQWLQSTFANRFNQYRAARGHLFQSRYKALLVEEGEPLAMVAHYLHLNPVRAHAIPADRLAHYRYSSYWYLRRPSARPPFLDLGTALRDAGGLADSPAGWARYAQYLRWQSEEGPLGASKAYASLSKGWALGSVGFKQTLIKDHAVAALARAWEDEGASEIRRARWDTELQRCLACLHKGPADILSDRKSADWKIAIALRLKRQTQALNGWIAERLQMGTAVSVSQLVSQLRQPSELVSRIDRLTEILKA
jgi:putative transposase